MTGLVDDYLNIRFVGRLAGRYTLPSHRGMAGVSTFACRTQGVTPKAVALSAPVLGKTDDPISANLEEIGLVHGHIARQISGGLAMAIDEKTNDMDKLARRIHWVKRRKAREVADVRSHKRILPRNPHTTLVLADGTRMPCFVIDMSGSGAAISADCRPAVGTPLAVGKVVARVVREMEVGFAVQFLEAQSTDSLETTLIKAPEELAS